MSDGEVSESSEDSISSVDEGDEQTESSEESTSSMDHENVHPSEDIPPVKSTEASDTSISSSESASQEYSEVIREKDPDAENIPATSTITDESPNRPEKSTEVDMPTSVDVKPPVVPLEPLPPAIDLQALLNTLSAQGVSPTAPQVSVLPPPPPDTQHARSIMPASSDTTEPSQNDESLFQAFLIDERRIMGNTAPSEFEVGARLFVGNITIDKVSKREIFFIFKKYGKLAQIALKSTFGFVQFLSAAECHTALECEQGVFLGGKKLHLEVSKPQVARGAGSHEPQRRRSRSPQPRRHSPPPGRREYRDYGRRDPSPPMFGRYERNERPDYRAPQAQYSHPPPIIPPTSLPQRTGSAVPAVQLVVTDDADRGYLQWIESSVRRLDLSCETMFLSSRVPFPDLVRQLVSEGVFAIVICDRRLQSMNKVSLQIFNQATMSSNVSFDEYADLDIPTAMHLLQQRRRPTLPVQRLTGDPRSQQNLASVISQMDPATLAALVNQIQGG